MALLTDEQVDEIRSKLEGGFRGPWLVTAVRRLLEDREERIRLQREGEASRGVPSR